LVTGVKVLLFPPQRLYSMTSEPYNPVDLYYKFTIMMLTVWCE